jgi:hypothetical protein
MNAPSKISKTAAITLALAMATAAPVSAQSIPGLGSIPGMPTLPTLPDLCLWSYCVSYTQSSLAAITAGIQAQFKNLLGIGNVQQNPLSQLSPLLAPATAASPNVAANSAQTILTQAPMTEQQLQAINANAAASQGAHSDAQASNDYLSTIATQSEQANIQHSQEVTEQQSDEQTTRQNMALLYSGNGW